MLNELPTKFRRTPRSPRQWVRYLRECPTAFAEHLAIFRAAHPDQLLELMAEGDEDGSVFEWLEIENLDLSWVNFGWCTFIGCTFKNCNLSFCVFELAQFGTHDGNPKYACSMQRSRLKEAIFDKAMLFQLNLDEVDAPCASFAETALYQVDSPASITGEDDPPSFTTFRKANLRNTRWHDVTFCVPMVTFDGANFLSADFGHVTFRRNKKPVPHKQSNSFDGCCFDAARFLQVTFEDDIPVTGASLNGITGKHRFVERLGQDWA